jgi:tRNA pseudouridine32 synthase/23S rRNA pseudouridine746 synthase/23S rRNA pseudouridine1911/1915/1917 synthase
VATWPSIRRDGVILENEAVLALDKPAGISVLGERHDTDLVRLAAEAGEELFPVHRIDKVTSGAVLFAKSLAVHGGLTRQFNRRTVDKAYLVITRSHGLPEHGTIDLPLTVGRKNRVRIAAPRESIAWDAAAGRWSVPPSSVRRGPRVYPSVTAFARLWEGRGHTVLLARPVTGRRHQIRVHLAWVGHPVDGDPLFDRTPRPRTFLHAWRLAFDASWADDHRVELEAEPGPDFWSGLGRRSSARPAALVDLARRAQATLDIPAAGTGGPGLPSTG